MPSGAPHCTLKRSSHRLDKYCLCYPVDPACPVGPKDRTGVNPVKRIQLLYILLRVLRVLRGYYYNFLCALCER